MRGTGELPGIRGHICTNILIDRELENTFFFSFLTEKVLQFIFYACMVLLSFIMGVYFKFFAIEMKSKKNQCTEANPIPMFCSIPGI